MSEYAAAGEWSEQVWIIKRKHERIQAWMSRFLENLTAEELVWMQVAVADEERARIRGDSVPPVESTFLEDWLERND